MKPGWESVPIFENVLRIAFENHFHAKGIEGKVLPRTKVENRWSKIYGKRRQKIALDQQSVI